MTNHTEDAEGEADGLCDADGDADGLVDAKGDTDGLCDGDVEGLGEGVTPTEIEGVRRHHLAGGSDSAGAALGRVCGLVDLKRGRRAGGGEDLVSGWREPLHAAGRATTSSTETHPLSTASRLGEVVPRPCVGGLGRRRGSCGAPASGLS